MDLDEALDIQSLTLPSGSPLEARFRTKIADQRMLIREVLHLSNNIKTGRAFPKVPTDISSSNMGGM